MRVSVKTCNNVRVHLDLDKIKSQRKIVNGIRHHYQLTLLDGKVLDVAAALDGVREEPEIDISPKNKFLNRLGHKIESETKKKGDT